MSGSILGKVFSVSTWGESHGKALGVVIDGCPSGISLTEEDISKDLDRRKPGSNPYSTKRNETDAVSILSGTFEGKTTGTPISLIVYNEDHNSSDYSSISDIFRPGHADYTFSEKYSVRDYRGGGRSSGRETLSRVAAGAVAKKILQTLDISVTAYTKSIGSIEISKDNFDITEINKNKVCMPDNQAAEAAERFLDKCIKEQDSAGGIVECIIKGLPAGIGEPVFDKLDSLLGSAIFSIGAVKGVEFGDGFSSSFAKGSENNDSFIISKNNEITKLTNHSGGILGGISDGSDVIFRAAFKPTPSIHKMQKTVTKDKKECTLQIKGRHDPIIVPRAVVVVEAMAALTITDLLFQNMYSSMAGIVKFYKN